jgi:phosphoglycolate phosphatase
VCSSDLDLGMTSLFSAVAGGDSFPVCKPHPDHLLGVIAAMNVPPENCVMIGDSANDILAAKAAKVASIAVAHGYGKDIGQLGADAIIPSFAELPQTIQRLGFSF